VWLSSAFGPGDGHREGLSDPIEVVAVQVGEHDGVDRWLRALARRSEIPVDLDLKIGHRMPEPVEVAAYYLVSECLTNAAKHSKASVVHVEVAAEERTILIAIRDDGVGGADATRGSGLIGLNDRVEALDGTMEISSPAGGGPRSASPCRPFRGTTEK
jgi:signal transduction histidine kinase